MFISIIKIKKLSNVKIYFNLYLIFLHKLKKNKLKKKSFVRNKKIHYTENK